MQIPADFRGYAGDPRSEIEVIFLFGLLYDHLHPHLKLPYVVTEITDAFPDCKGLDATTGRIVHIEFELKASHYKGHRHPLQGCDYIVCWENDWPDSPIPVISLKSMIDKEDLHGRRFIRLHRHGSVSERHENNRGHDPAVHNAIDYFLKELFPDITKRCPELMLKEGTTRFLFTFQGRAYPLLEIDPNGTISCKKVSEMIRLYTPAVEEAAQRLKDVKDGIGTLRNRRDAENLAKALEALVKSISKSLRLAVS